ncbi:MAG: aspartate carbamoyltransferase [Lachnospiraceae bacterium]|nr:aspartate carbamoyltransferase [Lachnospiraceae bacterium]
MKHFISADQFNRENLDELFDLTQDIVANPSKYSKSLEGKIVSVMFFEPSTRTRLSFESAILRLGGKLIATENAKTASSASKGESLTDTIRILQGYSDAIVMRHFDVDSSKVAASVANVPIINAGAGSGEHPTQALLDMYTIRESKGHFDGLKVAILGDLKYGRAIPSLLKLLSIYDNITIYALSKEAFSLPEEYIELMNKRNMKYVKCNSFSDIPKDVDVLYHTRIQRERFEGDFGKEEFIINEEVLNNFSENTILLHPLPRTEEISSDVDNNKRALFFKQAVNGMYVRMAILAKLLGKM